MSATIGKLAEQWQAAASAAGLARDVVSLRRGAGAVVVTLPVALMLECR